ncbi:Acetyltransferase (GNAT) family protein [uncultured archaeon]|nr:Acetyltransferase (GNAT) family protein [uncultured archaeon]
MKRVIAIVSRGKQRLSSALKPLKRLTQTELIAVGLKEREAEHNGEIQYRRRLKYGSRIGNAVFFRKGLVQKAVIGTVRTKEGQIVPGGSVHIITALGNEIASASFHERTFEGQKAILFSDLATNLWFRREGLSRQLVAETVAAAKRMAKRDGVKFLYTYTDKSNKGAIRLYKDMGFKKFTPKYAEDGKLYMLLKY